MRIAALFGAITLAGCLQAATVICSGTQISLTPGGPSPTVGCGGETFNNWTESGNPQLNLYTVTFNTANGGISLDMSANLLTPGSGPEYLGFDITGLPLDWIGLKVGYKNGLVTETLTNPGPVTTLSVPSPVFPAPITTTFDAFPMAVGPFHVDTVFSIGPGGRLATVVETFGTVAPEPTSALLIGIGLIAAAARWRRTKAG